jgi:hypothetical protein
MKNIVLLLMLFATIANAQQRRYYDNNGRGFNTENQVNNRIYNANYVEKKPFFKGGQDSLNNLYLQYFQGFDSLVARCVDKGDTAKYIRVHFQFVVDNMGTLYDAKFTYVGSTRYRASSGDKKIKYFDDLKPYFENNVKNMISHIPAWVPALHAGMRVACTVEDYFQLWLGTQPEN